MIYLEEIAQQCFFTGKDSELFLDKTTEDVWRVSSNPKYRNPDMSMDEALELEIQHQFIRLPKARDMNEIEIMDEYIDFVPENIQRDLAGILRQPLPFQPYRSRLERARLLDDYMAYRIERGADILADWFEEHEIDCFHQIVPANLSSAYLVRKLTDKDAPKAARLQKKSVRQVRTELYKVPENALLDQKFYIGYFDGESLAAVLDLVLDFPKRGTARLITLEGNQAASLLPELEKELARAGYAHIEIESKKADPWQDHGYTILKEENGTIVLGKEQELPEEEYVPEFEEQSEWTF